MKYARIQVLPETPPGGLTAGIDWGSADHAVCVVDAAGQVRARFTVAHDRAGIGKLIAGLRAAGVSEAAIERSDGVLVDALLEAGLTLVVITSRQMKNLRSRYGSAGAKDDRFDAFVLADVLRTDRARLRPLAVDMPATIALRAAVRARRDLVAHRIAACNQLRAHLAAAFPGAVRAVRAPGQPDQPGVPGPVRVAGCGRPAERGRPGGVAAHAPAQGERSPARAAARAAASRRTRDGRS